MGAGTRIAIAVALGIAIGFITGNTLNGIIFGVGFGAIVAYAIAKRHTRTDDDLSLIHI